MRKAKYDARTSGGSSGKSSLARCPRTTCVATKSFRTIRIPAAIGFRARESLHWFDTRAVQNELRKFFVDAKGRCDIEGHVSKGFCRLRDQPWDVARRVLAGREHIRKNRHLGGAGLHAIREPARDIRRGELHVRVAHNHPGSGHRLDQIRHAAEHVVRLGFNRAMVDNQNSLHMTCKMAGSNPWTSAAPRPAKSRGAT